MKRQIVDIKSEALIEYFYIVLSYIAFSTNFRSERTELENTKIIV
jgi:hypothetical protein